MLRARQHQGVSCSAWVQYTDRAPAVVVRARAEPRVLLFADRGAGPRCVKSTLQRLRQHIRPSVRIETVTAGDILGGQWQDSCQLLVVPGGADLPYCAALHGAGTRLIREYVESGGAYLGLCAGAYFACSRVVFEPGLPLEVVGPRELCFFGGIARGSVYPGFEYGGEAGSVAAPVEFLANLPPPCKQSGAAVSSVRSGAGAAGAANADANAPSGRLRLDQLEPQQLQPSATVAADDASARERPASDTWVRCLDYSNGGPKFLDAAGGQDLKQLADDGIQVLARYCDPQHEGAVAALRCRVSNGIAVLCGTHPEMDPYWMDPLYDSANPAALPQQSRPGVADDTAAAGGPPHMSHAARIKAQLEACQVAREQFWHMLLAACCLPE